MEGHCFKKYFCEKKYVLFYKQNFLTSHLLFLKSVNCENLSHHIVCLSKASIRNIMPSMLPLKIVWKMHQVDLTLSLILLVLLVYCLSTTSKRASFKDQSNANKKGVSEMSKQHCQKHKLI